MWLRPALLLHIYGFALTLWCGRSGLASRAGAALAGARRACLRCPQPARFEREADVDATGVVAFASPLVRSRKRAAPGGTSEPRPCRRASSVSSPASVFRAGVASRLQSPSNAARAPPSTGLRQPCAVVCFSLTTSTSSPSAEVRRPARTRATPSSWRGATPRVASSHACQKGLVTSVRLIPMSASSWSSRVRSSRRVLARTHQVRTVAHTRATASPSFVPTWRCVR